MLAFLADYGLFLAKTLTIIFAIILTLGAILALVQRAKREDGTLLITSLNEKYEDLTQNLQAETLDKSDLKKWQKAQQKENKSKKKKSKENKTTPRLFVYEFDGDIKASETHGLREIVSAIISIATPDDQVLVIVDSAGGYVHNYGLAASQLHRLRQHNLNLTVAIDKCAASGGYLMACVANQIIAAPFAIVGSIGVIGQLPNFHKLLEKNHIDFEIHTAGEFKRTLTLFGENTDKGRKKFQEEIEETHLLFKQFIAAHRPEVDINHIATGEHWHAVDAQRLKLVDDIKTSDDYILAKIPEWDVFQLSFEEKQKLSEKIAGNILASIEKKILKWLSFRPVF